MKKFSLIICFAFLINCSDLVFDYSADKNGVIISKSFDDKNKTVYKYEVEAFPCNLHFYSKKDFSIGDTMTFESNKEEVGK